MAPHGTAGIRMSLDRKKSTLHSAAVALSLALVSPQAFAYLDPSTGSMVVSALIGIFASIALAVKTYWYKLRKLFWKKEPARHDAAKNTSGEA